jgi:transposase
MDELGLFTAALGLSAPWRVTRTGFDGERLDLSLDFPRGARFACPAKDCAQGACPVHDTTDKTWRHMDFFQYQAFLHARLPRAWGGGRSVCPGLIRGRGSRCCSRRWR